MKRLLYILSLSATFSTLISGKAELVPLRYPLKSYLRVRITLRPSWCYLIERTNNPLEKHRISCKSIPLLSISAILPVAHSIYFYEEIISESTHSRWFLASYQASLLIFITLVSAEMIYFATSSSVVFF